MLFTCQLKLIDHSVQILYVVTDLFPTSSRTEKNILQSHWGYIYVSQCGVVGFYLLYIEAMLVDA